MSLFFAAAMWWPSVHALSHGLMMVSAQGVEEHLITSVLRFPAFDVEDASNRIKPLEARRAIEGDHADQGHAQPIFVRTLSVSNGIARKRLAGVAPSYGRTFVWIDDTAKLRDGSRSARQLTKFQVQTEAVRRQDYLGVAMDPDRRSPASVPYFNMHLDPVKLTLFISTRLESFVDYQFKPRSVSLPRDAIGSETLESRSPSMFSSIGGKDYGADSRNDASDPQEEGPKRPFCRFSSGVCGLPLGAKVAVTFFLSGAATAIWSVGLWKLLERRSNAREFGGVSVLALTLLGAIYIAVSWGSS